MPGATVFGAELEGDEVFLASLALEVADGLLKGDFLLLYRCVRMLHKTWVRWKRMWDYGQSQ